MSEEVQESPSSSSSSSTIHISGASESDRSSDHQNRQAAAITKEEIRQKAIAAVEQTLLAQLKFFTEDEDSDSDDEDASDRSPAFTYPAYSDKRNVVFDEVDGLVPVNDEDVILSVTSWTSPAGQAKYTRMMLVLGEIHRLLIDDERVTKRELYYQLLGQGGGTASQVDEAIYSVSAMLRIPRTQLRILATSKGLVAGKMSYVNSDHIEVDCEAAIASGGESLPNDVDEILSVQAKANVVVIVEKDATFQRLLEENFLSHADAILITGKGYPDMNTRKLIKRLATENPELQLMLLVDGDPHGIEIMCIYTYGSVQMAWIAEPLAVPRIQWVGIHPSSFDQIDEDKLHDITESDVKKVKSILERPHVGDHVKHEIGTLLASGQKAEIEDVDSPSRYLWEVISEL